MPEAKPILMVAAAVVLRGGRVLLTRRSAGSHLAGHWEFPGGKVEPGEDPPGGLAREMREELGVEATVGAPFAFNYHEYADRRVLLLTYLTEISGTPRPLGCSELGWFGAREIPDLATPPADVPIFERLRPMLSP
ncbi:MAG TPA: (deoxy)nucleoside triphosphate pyrophosphohydrolase [Candidatus Polarisedimenticolia bacterium]|jgi:8-oxo-dGTP diphosphatase